MLQRQHRRSTEVESRHARRRVRRTICCPQTGRLVRQEGEGPKDRPRQLAEKEDEEESGRPRRKAKPHSVSC